MLSKIRLIYYFFYDISQYFSFKNVLKLYNHYLGRLFFILKTNCVRLMPVTLSLIFNS